MKVVINSIRSLPNRCVSITRKFSFLSLVAIAGCGNLPGPSVPYQPGKNLLSARTAVQSCARFAPRGGGDAVAGSYVAGVVLGGLVVGPIIVASNQRNIRANGEARAVDRCLSDQGYVRRDLTPSEVHALRTRNKYQREILLDHLIGGGTLQTFNA